MSPPIAVTPVDAPPRLDRVRVVVTPEDVARGVRGRADACPVYHALTRTLRRETRVMRDHFVYYDAAAPEALQSLAGYLQRWRRELPPDVARRVDEFDRAGTFPLPCEFDVDP